MPLENIPTWSEDIQDDHEDTPPSNNGQILISLKSSNGKPKNSIESDVDIIGGDNDAINQVMNTAGNDAIPPPPPSIDGPRHQKMDTLDIKEIEDEPDPMRVQFSEDVDAIELSNSTKPPGILSTNTSLARLKHVHSTKSVVSTTPSVMTTTTLDEQEGGLAMASLKKYNNNLNQPRFAIDASDADAFDISDSEEDNDGDNDEDDGDYVVTIK